MFDAELYTIGKTLSLPVRDGGTGRVSTSQSTSIKKINPYSWRCSPSAIEPLQQKAPGPDQWLARHIIASARHIIASARQLAEQGVAAEICCVVGFIGMEGNEKAYEAVNEAAQTSGIQRSNELFNSLAQIE